MDRRQQDASAEQGIAGTDELRQERQIEYGYLGVQDVGEQSFEVRTEAGIRLHGGGMSGIAGMAAPRATNRLQDGLAPKEYEIACARYLNGLKRHGRSHQNQGKTQRREGGVEKE